MQNLRCPYCFELFAPVEIEFRCINPNPQKCTSEEDAKLAAFLDLTEPPRLQRVIPSPTVGRTLPQTAVCPCGVETTKRLCPRCHNELPSQFGTSESVTIALIGAKATGKSNYIGVIVRELRERVLGEYDAALNALDERTIKRYNRYFEEPLFRNHQVVPATTSAGTGSDVRYPLIYRLSVSRKRMFRKSLLVSTLVFFDTAGEDLAIHDRTAFFYKYLEHCDGLIILLDPLQMWSLYPEVPEHVPKPVPQTDQQNVADIYIQVLRELQGLEKGSQLIQIPTAVAFSKMDAVWEMEAAGVDTGVDVGSPVRRGPRHRGWLDLDDVEEVHKQMEYCLAHKWGGANLNGTMKHHFKTFRYFGVSALGRPPSMDGKITSAAVAPHRVEDPILWLLYQLGLIEGRRGDGK